MLSIYPKYSILIIFIFTIIVSGCVGDNEKLQPYSNTIPYNSPLLQYEDNHMLLPGEVLNRTVKIPRYHMSSIPYEYSIPIEINNTYKIYVSTNLRGTSVSGWYTYYINQSKTDRFGMQYTMIPHTEGWGESNDNTITNYIFTIPPDASYTPSHHPSISFTTHPSSRVNADINITLIKL